MQQNGWIPLGTDFPVEDISPFKTFLAAVVRKDASGFPVNGFQTENALSRQDAYNKLPAGLTEFKLYVSQSNASKGWCIACAVKNCGKPQCWRKLG